MGMTAGVALNLAVSYPQALIQLYQLRPQLGTGLSNSRDRQFSMYRFENLKISSR